jgi:hypothetical protein
VSAFQEGGLQMSARAFVEFVVSVESVVSDGCMSCCFAFVGFGKVRYAAVGAWLL